MIENNEIAVQQTSLWSDVSDERKRDAIKALLNIAKLVTPRETDASGGASAA